MSNGLTAWSYSRYADYQRCPLAFKLKHIDRDPRGKADSSPAMERGITVHKQGEGWLVAKRKHKLPDPYKYFAAEMEQLRSLNPMVEQQWGFTENWEPTSWFGADTWLRLVCDVAVVYDDGDSDIVDFKTGRKYDTNQDQMDLFSTGIFMKFPEVEHVTARLWYLDIEDPKENRVEIEYTRDDFERIKKDWTGKVRPMFKDKRFAPTPNFKCKWCPFAKDKGGPCKYNSGS